MLTVLSMPMLQRLGASGGNRRAFDLRRVHLKRDFRLELILPGIVTGRWFFGR